MVSQYKTHLEPNFVGINLPAYFGGITLQNKSIEQFDICEVLSYLKGDLLCTLYVCIFGSVKEPNESLCVSVRLSVRDKVL